MQSSSHVDERLRKLLLYVGEEGKLLEGRDVKHLSSSAQSIFEKHFKLESQIAPLISLITKCIVSVPHKQHLYAMMTGYLSKNNEDKIVELINCVLLELQSNLNAFNEGASLNIIMYLSQLMNFNIVNSFIFLSWMQSILAEAKKADSKEKGFYMKVIIKSLPYSWRSLDQKLPQDFKKVMEKIDKQVENLPPRLKPFWNLFYQQYSSRILKDYSAGEHLRQQQEEKQQFKQFSPSFKLSFKDKTGYDTEEAQFRLQIEDDDPNYKEFLGSIQAFLEKERIERIVQSYSSAKSIFYDKIKDYLVKSQNSLLPKYLIEIFWKLILVKPSQESIIFASVFTTMAVQNEAKLKKDLTAAIQSISLAIFTIGEKLNLAQVQKFVSVLSFYVSNVQNPWEWGRWVQQQNLFQRHVILRLTFQKVLMLSDFKPSSEITPFIPTKSEPATLDSKQSIFETKIQQKLNSKSQSDQIIELITNVSQFTIFLDALLKKMSNSFTHLRKLTDRYEKVFKSLKFERQTFTNIYNFWQHSQYHKIQYFCIFLQKGMISFEKFVEGISMKAKLGTEVEKILLRRVYEKVKEKVNESIADQGLQTDLDQSLAL